MLHVLEAMAPVDPVGSADSSGDAPPPDVPRDAANASAANGPIWDHRPEAMVEAAD